MGAGTVVDTPPPATSRGGFSFPSLATGSEGATIAAKLINREFDAMNTGFLNLVQADPDIKQLRHTVEPNSSQNAALMRALSILLLKVKAVRPHGEDLANLVIKVLLQLDPTPQIAADACVEPGEPTSWRNAGQRLAPFLNVDRHRTVDGQAGDLRSHVLQLRAAYGHILNADDGYDHGALRALDRLAFTTFSQFFTPAWGNVTPSVTDARNLVEQIVTGAQRVLRFGPEELYALLSRRFEAPVVVPVPVATNTPIHSWLTVFSAIHDYRMLLHRLLHYQAAINQMRLLSVKLPTGTDPHLDHMFQATVQGLL